MTPDSELLKRYVRDRSEEAFAELVRRHVDLVYSTALRRLNGDASLAEDATQAVFTDLARKASALSQRTSLTGWLYTSAHFAAAQIVRTEARRRDREERFMSEPDTTTVPDADWEKLRPVLDDVMLELKEADREAILLRYFENRPLADVGAKLGLAENAARMRVERALEKLRASMARRGVQTSSSFLAAISANAVSIAPAGMAASLATASGVATASVGTFTLLSIMTTTKLTSGIAALVLVGATTALFIQHQAQTKLRAENESLQKEVAQLQAANEKFSNELPAADNSKSLPNDQLRELLKLRGEVGLLRAKTNELGKVQRQNGPQATENANEPDFDSVQIQEKRIAEAKINDAKLMALGELTYADDHHGQLTTNFDVFGSFLTNTDQKSTGTNGFELVYQGATDALSNNAGSVIMMREPQSWPTSSGRWARTYVFMDGHVEIHSADSDDFDAFEQEHSLPAMPSQ